MNDWQTPVRWWILMALPITALCIGAYAVGQQVLRQSINDVPVQMAQDAAARLSGGDSISNVVGTGAPPVDIAGSLAPWVVVYDPQGTPLAYSAVLNNAPPQLPLDTFNHLDFWAHGHSWQPEPNVREDVALVRTADGKYVVAAGRNMSEMERHIEHLGSLMLVGWIATLGATLVWCFVVCAVMRKN